MPDHNINAALGERAVPIGSVKPHPENYNQHDINAIAQSLTVNGQYRPIVVDANTSFILAGNGTWAAAKKLGWPAIAADLVDVDAVTARRILLVDNFATTPDYDEMAVLAILNELGGDLDGTGLDGDDYAKLLAKAAPPLPEPDEGGDDSDRIGSTFAVMITCDDEQDQAELIERFIGEGMTVKALVV